MPVNVKPLFDKIMKDPDIIPDEGQEKEDLAMSMVLQRATQSINNEKALSMAKSDNSVSKLLDFVSISKGEDTTMAKPVRDKLASQGHSPEDIEQIRLDHKGVKFLTGDAKMIEPKAGTTETSEEEDAPEVETDEQRMTRLLENQGFTGSEIDDFSDDDKQNIVAMLAKDPTLTSAALKTKLEDPAEVTSAENTRETMTPAQVARIEEDLKTGAAPLDEGEQQEQLEERTTTPTGEGEDEGTVQQGPPPEVLTDTARDLGESDSALNRTMGTGKGQATSGTDTREEERSDTVSYGGTGASLGEVGERGTAKKPRDVSASELPTGMGGDEDSSSKVNELMQTSADAVAKAKGTSPEKEFDKLQVSLQRLLGPIAEQYARNDDFRTGTAPRVAAYKGARENGWGKWFLGAFKPTTEGGGTPTNAGFYEQVGKWAEQLQKETEEIDPPEGTASKPTTKVARSLKTKNHAEARTAMEKVWSPENTTHLTPKEVKTNIAQAQNAPKIPAPSTRTATAQDAPSPAMQAAQAASDKADAERAAEGQRRLEQARTAAQAREEQTTTTENQQGQGTTTPDPRYGGSPRAQLHLREQLGEEEFDSRLKAGDLGSFDDQGNWQGVKSLSQARQHVEDNKSSETTDTTETTETPDERAVRLATEREGAESQDTTDTSGGTKIPPPAKPFGGRKNTAAERHLKEQLGDSEFNNRLEAGEFDKVRNKGQANQHLIDKKPPDAGPVPEPTTGTGQSTTPPSNKGAVQGEMDMGGDDTDEPTTETGTEDTDGTGDGDADSTGGGADDDTSGGEEEVPPVDAEKQRIMDLAEKDGLFEHMAQDDPYSYADAAVAKEAMAKIPTDKLGKQLGKIAKTKKATEKADAAIATNKQKTADAEKTAELKASANDGDLISRLSTELPDGMDEQTAVDHYRQIAEHERNHADSLSDGTKAKLNKAKEKIIEQNPKADFQGVQNTIDRNEHHWDSEEGQAAYQNDVTTHKQELSDKSDFSDHVSGDSGSAARKNAFDNNDSSRVVHTDDDGKVTHSTLMDSRFENGRKKVEEAGERGAAAHDTDPAHEEIHGGKGGKRNQKTHHDWDTSKRGQHGDVGQEKIKAYSDAKEAMDAAKEAGDSAEVKTQKKNMKAMDKESGGALGKMMSETDKEQQRIDRGQPPGPPPRPGLVWAAGIHHWVSPEKLSEMQGGLADGEGMHITPEDFQGHLGDNTSDPAGTNADGSQGHQGAIHVTKFGIHRVTDTPDPAQGTPANLPQHLGGSAKQGSPADLASHSMSTALTDAGLMRRNPDGSMNYGKSGKVAKGKLGKVGDDLHGRDSHGEGTDVQRPISSPYVAEVRDLKNKESSAKRKRQLNTAIGRFRAIREAGVKAAGKASWEAAGRGVKSLGRGAKTKARKTKASAGRGGTSALRAFMGEYAGAGGLEAVRMGMRDIKEQGKEVGRAMPIVGPDAGARKGVKNLIRHVKSGAKQERAKAEAAHTARNERAIGQLKNIKNKPKEE